MERIEWLVCRAFIDKQTRETKEAILSVLSPEQKKKILALPPAASDLSLGFDKVKYLLTRSHYSWFAPFLRTLSENEISLFLAAFPEKKAEALGKLLLFSSPLFPLTRIGQNFLQKKLAASLLKHIPNLPPPEALPQSPLNSLLELESETLELLVDFLGLYDLAAEMRLIIDKVTVKKIGAALSPEKALFFSNFVNRLEPSPFKRMELASWNGKTEDLLLLITKSGLNRLAKALYAEDPGLFEYIKLRMSTDKATLFSSFYKEAEPRKAYNLLKRQIPEVLTFFKKHNLQAPS